MKLHRDKALILLRSKVSSVRFEDVSSAFDFFLKGTKFICLVRKHHRVNGTSTLPGNGEEMFRRTIKPEKIRVVFDNGVVAEIHKDRRINAFVLRSGKELTK